MSDEFSTATGGRGRPVTDDTLVAEVTVQAQQMRESFGKSRRDYNSRVCDMLAAAGLAPTANLTLKAGRWGSLGDVQADVRGWYADLFKKKADQQIDIPPAARRRAYELIEQLFALASQDSQLRLEERVAPLRQAAETAREQATALAAQLAQKEEAHLVETSAAQAREVTARATIDEMSALAEKTQAQASRDLQDAKDRAQALSQKIDDVLAQGLARERELERHVADLREATGQAQAKAAQDLLAANKAAEGDRRALLRSMDEERQQHGVLLQGLTEDLANSRQRVEQLLVEMSSLTRQVNTMAAESQGLKQALELMHSSGHRKENLDRVFASLHSSGLQLVPSPRASKNSKSGTEDKAAVDAAFEQAARRLATELVLEPRAIADVLKIARR
jgi:hypothetical protein